MTVVREHSDIDLAYLAGMIDADGCICLSLSGDRVRFRMLITNTCYEMLEWVHGEFGGNLRTVRQSKTPKRKTLYEWQVRTRDALELLKKLHPFMKVKQTQCFIAIEFLQIAKVGNPEWKDDQVFCMSEMSFCNSTGTYGK